MVQYGDHLNIDINFLITTVMRSVQLFENKRENKKLQ